MKADTELSVLCPVWFSLVSQYDYVWHGEEFYGRVFLYSMGNPDVSDYCFCYDLGAVSGRVETGSASGESMDVYRSVYFGNIFFYYRNEQ